MKFTRGKSPKEAMGIGQPVLIKTVGGDIPYTRLEDLFINMESIEVTTNDDSFPQYIKGKKSWTAVFDMDMCTEPIEVELILNEKRLRGRGMLYGNVIEGTGELEEF